MNGRYFGGRKVQAYIYDGREQFEKSKKKQEPGDDESRLEKFSQWIEESGR